MDNNEVSQNHEAMLDKTSPKDHPAHRPQRRATRDTNGARQQNGQRANGQCTQAAPQAARWLLVELTVAHNVAVALGAHISVLLDTQHS